MGKELAARMTVAGTVPNTVSHGLDSAMRTRAGAGELLGGDRTDLGLAQTMIPNLDLRPHATATSGVAIPKYSSLVTDLGHTDVTFRKAFRRSVSREAELVTVIELSLSFPRSVISKGNNACTRDINTSAMQTQRQTA